MAQYVREDAPRNLPSQRDLVRWFASSATLGFPQGAAPIAFALILLPLTGDAESGGAMILALTLAQVIGAVPVTRIGHRLNLVVYFRILIAIRTSALALIAIFAGFGVPLPWLVAAAGAAGLVNGAAFSFQRAVLSQLVAPAHLPRALGIAATLTEFTFVVAPVIASLVGSASALAAVWVMVLIGAAPIVLLPHVASASVSAPETHSGPVMLTPQILLWLCCAAATSSTVGGIEISAVALAVNFDLAPGWGALFTVALCVASVAGGLWVSVRNRRPSPRSVIVYLMMTLLGAILVALNISIIATVIGAVIVGAFLAPLGTHYSLVLDALAPPQRRAEVFALLRTSQSIGFIVSSALLALVSLKMALVVAAVAVAMASIAVTVTHLTKNLPRSS